MMSVCAILGLCVVSLLIVGSVANKGCYVDSDCEQHESCIGDTHECVDLRDNCNFTETCGVNATCEVRNHNVQCIYKPGHRGTQDSPCEELGSYHQNMTTYEVYLYDLKSQPEAMLFCLTKGSRLVSITNTKKQLEVENYLTEHVPPGKTFWIWTSGVYNTNGVMWPTSSKVSDYTNFSDSAYKVDSCVTLKQERRYRWGTYPCQIKQAFVCEKSVEA